ncbi:type II toxin-antitoxin system PemK/MazF family toxin [Clostridium haemolyticum]|uniref:Uncharacterized protein n=1 Tax=Clostridium haemolyticum NCTC 9693 TaxID=1443114 RepID=A0ABR4TEG7_CLOHA|nr:type II toxin-antitoxin system PemK/MazF family toxin [Clostridium haemolyticum]KEI16742.1 hypothetical protein Z960_08315 [Clostridium haemolyticum NCTC 9693]KGN04688.1 hypothetical protein Z961_01415 [Clostridium haemolyticum NCTC 8350]
MRFSDIKIGHIYNVIFDPVRFCEFNGKHLALVLKRNNDNQTYIVMPLTSESNGVGVNKIKLLKSLYEKECVIKVKNLAYDILRLRKGIKENKNEIERIEQQIKDTINNILYNLNQKYVDDGIKDILDNIIKR